MTKFVEILSIEYTSHYHLLSFASPKERSKEKAMLGQRLRRPRNSSTLLTQFATQQRGACFMPTIALV